MFARLRALRKERADGEGVPAYALFTNEQLAERRAAETARQGQEINTHALQAAYTGALALTAHADATAWRREQLRRLPLEADLAAQ